MRPWNWGFDLPLRANGLQPSTKPTSLSGISEESLYRAESVLLMTQRFEPYTTSTNSSAPQPMARRSRLRRRGFTSAPGRSSQQAPDHVEEQARLDDQEVGADEHEPVVHADEMHGALRQSR